MERGRAKKERKEKKENKRKKMKERVKMEKGKSFSRFLACVREERRKGQEEREALPSV